MNETIKNYSAIPIPAGFEIKIIEYPAGIKGKAVMLVHPDDYKILEQNYKLNAIND